ncbi:444R [Invertebrate iridescent virus Kaz2018]|nr:444R [Invertebrate iridescent virus Kaz2018]
MVKSKNRKFNTYGFVFTSCRWYNDWCYNFKRYNCTQWKCYNTYRLTNSWYLCCK